MAFTVLDERLLLEGTVGCREDPIGVPTCTLNDVPLGECPEFTIKVLLVDIENSAGQQGSVIESTVSVSSPTFDPNPKNDSDTVEVEVADPIFADGFESGDTSAWQEGFSLFT